MIKIRKKETSEDSIKKEALETELKEFLEITKKKYPNIHIFINSFIPFENQLIGALSCSAENEMEKMIHSRLSLNLLFYLSPIINKEIKRIQNWKFPEEAGEFDEVFIKIGNLFQKIHNDIPEARIFMKVVILDVTGEIKKHANICLATQQETQIYNILREEIFEPEISRIVLNRLTSKAGFN